MKKLIFLTLVSVGLFSFISCEKKDRKVIKVDANGAIDKTKDALKDAGNFIEKKSKEAVETVKEKTK
ncbi:hypothetical protein [Wenyingzhuangia sp. 2_MG-2023]|uniref:hypothetical protein n=1 Tax=Wenyingzhuangia sp. 2_MG-2023 TaxID=3062639 RepID=UPI0026E27E62|nr:hypothetical protein [Wenyingzhuangia sp. 2_MG-2023]MDO6738056.1 hypothetical protein [Wenyingzhuangia sp. 2_MG-2023]